MEKERESFKAEFISTSGVYKTPFSLIVILQFYLGLLTIILVNLWYWNYLYYFITGNLIFPMEIVEDEWFKWLLILLLPLNIYGNIFIFAISIVLFSTGIFKILNKLHPTREGVFEKGSKDWKYMHRRFWTAYFPIWLARALPLPWSDIFVYRFFGVRIGKNVVAYEGYIDPELVEIGDFTMTSVNIGIFSHLIYQDKVIIKRVKIGRACIVGPQTITAPGTIIHDGAVLGANSYTSIGQELESDLIHVGTPVSMSFPIQTLEESIEKDELKRKEENSTNNGGVNE